MARSDEKDWIRIATEMMTENMKRADAVAEVSGHILGRPTIDKIGPESFINTLFGAMGVEEKRTAIT